MIGCFYTNSDFQGFFEKGDIDLATQGGLTGKLVLMWNGKVIEFGAGLSHGIETCFNILKGDNEIRGGQLNLNPRDIGQVKSSGKYSGLNHDFAHLALYDALRLEIKQREEYDILRQMLGVVDGRTI